ncbi:MAG TPA: response regulator transcription factor [Chthoniobacter sp.]|nr:response regulator transcription factor [Chthoniobacter sp.]
MKNRVVVVDDHASIRQMLGIVLTREGPYEMVGEAGTGFEALKVCRKVKPQMVVLDLVLPELNGVEVLRALRAESREMRCIVYSGTLNRHLIVEALQARPHGFVHKTDALPTFCEALRAVASGCSYFTPFATRLMDDDRRDPGHHLTYRERAVLQMIAEGMSNKEMASRFSIAPKTVEHHRAQVMQKLGMHDVATLTRYAVHLGLVPVEV